MRIVEVIGSVTLSRVHPSLIGARWLVGVPFSLEGLKADRPDGEDLVIYEARDYREIPYRVGENLVRRVMVRGETIVERPAVGVL